MLGENCFPVTYYISEIVAYNSYFCSFLFQVFEDYFKDVEEESIRDNFVIIYELLDETMDFGYTRAFEREAVMAQRDTLIDPQGMVDYQHSAEA